MDPQWLRLVHILGAIVLFGVGLGSAFHMWRAGRSGEVAAVAVVTRSVVLVDALFIAPAVVVQPVTGVLLAQALGWSLGAGWILVAVGLYLLIGVCWLPVVWIQVRMARLSSRCADQRIPLPPLYHRLAAWWFWLGWPAFAAMIGIVHLMVLRPEL